MDRRINRLAREIYRDRTGKMATKRIDRKPKKFGVRYPWERWFRNKVVTLKRGTHFDGQPHGFAMTARQAAQRLGYKVSVRIESETVTLTVVA